MQKINSFINLVIDQMEDSHLKEQLTTHFPSHNDKLALIEQSFVTLTNGKKDKETLYSFFHSWSQTNNSAMTVSGLSNRLTMIVHKDQEVADEHALFKAVASLNRIADEDLAVVGRVLHSQLFYTMATNICGDDAWLSRQYLSQEAKDFKSWKDKNSLNDKDIMIGLLTTLVHEIYTHGEVEYILPKFTQWLQETTDLSEPEIKHTLAWIQVHCGPTERDHFFHAVSAVNHFAKAQNINIADYDLSEIISTYVSLKSNVMAVLTNELEFSVA